MNIPRATAQEEALQPPDFMGELTNPVNLLTMILGGLLPKLLARAGGTVASEAANLGRPIANYIRPSGSMVRMGPETFLQSSQILGSAAEPTGTQATHPLVDQIIHELMTNRGISNFNIGDIMRYQAMRPGMDFYKAAYKLPGDLPDLTPGLAEMLRQMMWR